MDVTSKPPTQNTRPKTCATRSAGTTAILPEESNRPRKKAHSSFCFMLAPEIFHNVGAGSGVIGKYSGLSWRPVLTPIIPRHRLRFDIQQVWDAGKAVRIGHGPATVIGETP